jgi:hypothetical protein
MLRDSLAIQFCALATMAAIAADLTGASPLHAWLNRLKEGPRYESVAVGSSLMPAEGSRVVEGGWIHQLCLASAECCVLLETEAYERRRTKPRMFRSSERVGGPRLSEWLRAQLASRGNMTVNRLHSLSNLDRKTIGKILDGQQVRATALLKLADSLSSEGATVSVSDIPTD